MSEAIVCKSFNMFGCVRRYVPSCLSDKIYGIMTNLDLKLDCVIVKYILITIFVSFIKIVHL